MGSKTSKPVRSYKQCCEYLTTYETKTLQNIFKLYARSDELAYSEIINSEREKLEFKIYKDWKIEKNTFIKKILIKRFSNWSINIIERIFQICDSNGDGSISYEEFICCMYIIDYSERYEKLKFIWTLFDLSGGEELINTKSFKKIAIALMEPHKEIMNQKKFMKTYAGIIKVFVFNVMQHYSDDRQSLSYSEWRNYAENDDVIQDFIKDMEKTHNVHRNIYKDEKKVKDKTTSS